MESRNETCPCCGKENMICDIGAFDICRNCGWEDDPVQRSNHDAFGANRSDKHGRLTLNEARKLLSNGENLYEGYPRQREEELLTNV